MRILFTTPETSDFVQVGGLAAVSAALPRAPREHANIRIVIRGYSEVLVGLQQNLTIVGRCAAFAGLPAFEIGLGHAVDGLPYYVILCPGLLNTPAHRTAISAVSIGVTTMYASRHSRTAQHASRLGASVLRSGQELFRWQASLASP
jgi:glycogen synthase